MQVYLDEQRCDVQADSVADAISAAARIALARGRTITDVIVDGQRWSADTLSDGESQSARAAEVRLNSADARELVCETFADAAAALAEVEDLQRRAAERIQEDRLAEAMPGLAQALEVWASVHKAVELGAAMAALDLEPHREAIESLAVQLRAIRASLEQRDVVALADTLLYDLPEAVTQWRSLLQDLSDEARRENA